MTTPAEERLSAGLAPQAHQLDPTLAPISPSPILPAPVDTKPSLSSSSTPSQPPTADPPTLAPPIAPSASEAPAVIATDQTTPPLPIETALSAPLLVPNSGFTPKQEPGEIENLMEAEPDSVDGEETMLATGCVGNDVENNLEMASTLPLAATSTTTLSSGSVTAPRRRRRSAASQPTGSIAPPASPSPAPTIPAIESFSGTGDRTNLQYTVTISKRSNGNQPWEPSNVRPPMLGKMRRMTVQFAPFEGISFEVLFQCKDLKPSLHEGRLVVSANDKGIARNADTAAHDESLFRTIVQPHLSSAQAVTVYLKPCWRGFGSNRERPVFSVTVAVRPAERECAFVILHSWNVELHSHKMESSSKGKAMDADGPFEVRGTIPLHILQQPALDSVPAATRPEAEEERMQDGSEDAPVE